MGLQNFLFLRVAGIGNPQAGFSQRRMARLFVIIKKNWRYSAENRSGTSHDGTGL